MLHFDGGWLLKSLQHDSVINHTQLSRNLTPVDELPTRYYTQTRLAEGAFSELMTSEDKELNQMGTIKMILMEQVCISAVTVN